MRTVRDEMIENGGNLDWCRPYKHKTENFYFVLFENKIITVMINGKEMNVTQELIAELAKKVSDDYDFLREYEWNDKEILINSDCWEELGCAECPWVKVCDAMSEEVEGF